MGTSDKTFANNIQNVVFVTRLKELEQERLKKQFELKSLIDEKKSIVNALEVLHNLTTSGGK